MKTGALRMHNKNTDEEDIITTTEFKQQLSLMRDEAAIQGWEYTQYFLQMAEETFCLKDQTNIKERTL